MRVRVVRAPAKMLRPARPDEAEELIYFYERLRWQWLNGAEVKITEAVEKKAEEIGFSKNWAWTTIRFAKEIGMIDTTSEMI